METSNTTARVGTDADDGPAPPDPWILRFDGACRRNPGPGGAGAALFKPNGVVTWTCSHYMPSSSETNNTAEYTALLLGVRSAVHHGAQDLVIEGDSHLVVAQVKGSFACRNQRLRQLRNRVRHVLRSLPSHTLRHIDRKANAHADRLANRALDLKRTVAECSEHQAAMETCVQQTLPERLQREQLSPDVRAPRAPAPLDDDNDEEIAAEIAARDGGETFPTLPIGPGSAPARQPRLRLRLRTDEEQDAAAAALQTMAEELACKVVDAESWASGEGYISAIPDRIRAVLQPYSATPPAGSAQRPHQHGYRPPRVTRTQREHRLDEALDDMHAVQRATPTDQRAVQRARRRVGRVRTSMAKQELRQTLAKDEAKCVERILKSLTAETAEDEHPETCPISASDLHDHFTGTNTPRINFLPDEACGERFRRAMAGIGQPPSQRDALTDDLTEDEVEDQLARTTGTSSPGRDGVGFVRLVHKKGNPGDPTNWRPICLQTAIYKLYSGLLAQRLSAYLEGNELLPMAQKGFRAFNGCHEHNFVATTLLDQTRRMHRKLYQVWYDLRNAFGSVHQDMLWYVLRLLGVEHDFITRCSNIYQDSFFVVGNTTDGATDPVRQEVGVYQGCPLSPLLSIAALVPLLRALEQLDNVGVSLADGVRPCATAYANDLKVFNDSAAGIKRCHAVVKAFLEWTGLRANAAKCASLAAITNASGNPARDESVQLELHDDAITSLSLQQSYRYLGGVMASTTCATASSSNPSSNRSSERRWR
ncbi:reverse transcriptase [Phytophthora megakarya]|uniref:Reverse transcriptase n=1 Tax=Phytophthora megakarya TaxID=4795 RepID=A0A225V5E2_9STRA|nr:reverse transcriptase [Phytophthora megakarya]